MNPQKNISHEIYLLQKKMVKKWLINQHSLLLVAEDIKKIFFRLFIKCSLKSFIQKCKYQY